MISVIVCTYNRSRYLPVLLEQFVAQKDAGEYEVVVVDNASTDDTAHIIKEFAVRHPERVKYVFEARLGLTAARNRGLRESRGDIVVFTDDDISVPEDWVRRIREDLSKDGVDGVFGKILPLWEVTPVPSWLLEDRRLQRCLALLDLGEETFIAKTRADQFFGAQFVLKRDVFSRVGNFTESLGMQGEVRVGEEDTDMFLRLLEAGCRLVYDPLLVVGHRIPAERTTDAFFRAWYFDHGIGIFRRAALGKGGRFSERKRVARECGVLAAGFVKAAVALDAKEWRYNRLKFMGFLGGLAAALRLR